MTLIHFHFHCHFHWFFYIYYKAKILQKIHVCVLAHVSFSYCVTQNQLIVQIYYHFDIDLSKEKDWNFNNFCKRSWCSELVESPLSLKPYKLPRVLIQWDTEVCILQVHFAHSISLLLCALTEKNLPIWNGEKEWTGSTSLDWLHGGSLHLFPHKK